MNILNMICKEKDWQENVLNKLRRNSKKIVIYGTGVYSYVLFKYLSACNIKVESFLIDLKYKKHEKYLELPVLCIDDINHINDYDIVIGITNYPDAEKSLYQLGYKNSYIIDVPDFLNIPAPFMDLNFIQENINSFNEAYSLLEDLMSQKTYIAAINTKITGDLSFIKEYVELDHLYFSKKIFNFTDKEVLLDVGGFNGDSIRDFCPIVSNKFKKIFSLEPFDTNFKDLQTAVKEIDLNNIQLIQIGAWNQQTTISFTTTEKNIDNKICPNDSGTSSIHVNTIDSILSKQPEQVTFIKMDINGAEYEAIDGATNTIRKDRPKIAIKLHVKENFYKLLILLKSIAPDIKLYVRQRNYMSMMLVLYGLFEEHDGDSSC